MQQSFALRERLIDKGKLSMLEVTESAMNQTAGPTRRPAAEVPLIENEDSELVERSLARDRRAVDAGADDDQIEGFFLHNVPKGWRPPRNMV